MEPHSADLTPANAEELLAGVDIVLDGTDNFETRYLINDFAVSEGIPWIYAAAVASYGVTMTVLPGETACLACIFPDSPRGMVETCDTSGILNSAVNLVALDRRDRGDEAGHRRARQAAPDACSRTTCGRTNMQKSSTARPRADCRACQQRDFVHLAGEGRPHITLCGRNSVQIHERQRPVDFAEMTRRLNAARHSAAQRICAEVLARTLRDDALSRRPGHHQGNHRHGDRAQSVCAICGVVGVTWGCPCLSFPAFRG